MGFAIHIAITAVLLLIVAKLLRDVEVDNIFTALVAGLILGVLHNVLARPAEHLGHWTGEFLAGAQLSVPMEFVVANLIMLSINAVILKLAAAFGPGFRISGFGTAMLAALLMLVFNRLVEVGIDFFQASA